MQHWQAMSPTAVPHMVPEAQALVCHW